MTARPTHLDVVVVGAGFAGLYQLHRLREPSACWVVLVEAGSDLGGIWHWNCYPGARVDTHVPMYEYSDEQVWRDWYWEERFPDWQALRRYFDHVDDVWDLRRDIRFDTRITSGSVGRGDRTAGRLHTDAGEQLQPASSCSAPGSPPRPYIPDLPGLDRLRGRLAPHRPLAPGRPRPRPGSASASSAPEPAGCR